MTPREKVLKLGNELIKHQLIARTWGNISYRVDQDHFVITPSGKRYQDIKLDDLVLVAIKDLSYEGSIKPSSEKGIHATVYQVNPEINCVIHTHQTNASAMSASGKRELKTEQGIICIAKYALPGTKQLKNNVKEALSISKTQSILMQYHGAICFGRDDHDALNTALDLEKLFKLPELNLRQNQSLLENTKIPEGSRLISSDDLLSLQEDLKPYLDDFAQLVGVKAPMVKKHEIKRKLTKYPVVIVKELGAIVKGEDMDALEMVTLKAAKAARCAKTYNNSHAIPYFERLLMRVVYKYKYSKQADKI